MPIPLDELNRALIPRVLTPATTIAELLYLFAEQPEPRRGYAVVRIATPQIWNTDQGSQFTSPQLTGQLEAAGVRISMDGKGRAYDNIFTERLWRSLKHEEIYLADYGSPREARAGIGQYFQFYNTEGPHPALDYRRPADLYHG